MMQIVASRRAARTSLNRYLPVNYEALQGNGRCKPLSSLGHAGSGTVLWNVVETVSAIAGGVVEVSMGVVLELVAGMHFEQMDRAWRCDWHVLKRQGIEVW